MDDNILEMIAKSAKDENPLSPEEIKQGMFNMLELEDEVQSNNPWIKRYHTLPVYSLDVVRDDSNEYRKALADAIVAITGGDYGSIDYRGYKIHYNETPYISSYSVKDGSVKYSYDLGFVCDALLGQEVEEYSSEDERKAFLDPEDDSFVRTVTMLDRVIKDLDEGTWLREKKTLRLFDFKYYNPELIYFNKIGWDDREKDAAGTLSFLMKYATERAKGIEYTEDDFELFAGVIRRMVFFADYGKRNYLYSLEGFVLYKWEPETKLERYIWRCMREFGQGDVPDRLFDNCTIYYFLDDPQGWEAIAYILPIIALGVMCSEFDPDEVKTELLRVFDIIPYNGYVERIEKLIEEDRAGADKTGGSENDKEGI